MINLWLKHRAIAGCVFCIYFPGVSSSCEVFVAEVSHKDFDSISFFRVVAEVGMAKTFKNFVHMLKLQLVFGFVIQYQNASQFLSMRLVTVVMTTCKSRNVSRIR